MTVGASDPQSEYRRIIDNLTDKGFSEIDKTIADLQLLVSANQNFVPALMAMANSLQLRYQFGKKNIEDVRLSVSYLDKVVELSENPVEAYHKRALAYLNLSKFEKAHNDLDAALKLAPNNIKLLALKIESFLAESELEQAVSVANASIAQPSFNGKEFEIGQVFFAAQQWQSALDFFDRSNQANAELYFAKGYCYESLQKYDDAIKQYDLASKQEPGNVLVLLRLTELELKSKQFDKARATAKSVLKLQTDNVYAWRLMAFIYEQQANVYRAKAAWSRVKQIASDTKNKTYYDESVARIKKLSEFQ